VIEKRVQLAEAPALLVHGGDKLAAVRNGTILFHHGLGSKKEDNLIELRSLAARGFLAIGIDIVGHGERRYEDFESRMMADDAHAEVIEAVDATAREVPRIVDELIAAYDVNPARLGHCGISLGAIIGYGALLTEPRIRAAAPILGTPAWWVPAGDSPHLHPDLFFPVAILSQNAGMDENVPPDDAAWFHRMLTRYYRSDPERQRHVVFPDSGHFMTEKDWAAMWANVLAWFDLYLKGPRT